MKDLFSVAGKVAIVTGGSRGIGEMIAAGYLANGAKVYISSRKADVCDATAKRLSEQFGGECISLPADMSNVAGIEAFAAAFRAQEEHLDILVNNAGVAWGAPIEDFPEVGWDKVMDTNVKGVFFLTQKLLPLLEKNANSETPTHVINVGSIDGIKTPVFDNFSYGPSKAAVHHLTRVLAAHLIKRNIIVNGIAPGLSRLICSAPELAVAATPRIPIGTLSVRATRGDGSARRKTLQAWRFFEFACLRIHRRRCDYLRWRLSSVLTHESSGRGRAYSSADLGYS